MNIFPIKKAHIEERKCDEFIKRNQTDKAIACLNKSIEELEIALNHNKNSIITRSIQLQILHNKRRRSTIITHYKYTNCYIKQRLIINKNMSANKSPIKQKSFDEIQFLVNKLSCDTDIHLSCLFKILKPLLPISGDKNDSDQLNNDSDKYISNPSTTNTQTSILSNSTSNDNYSLLPQAIDIVKNLIDNNQQLKDNVFDLLRELQETKQQNLELKHHITQIKNSRASPTTLPGSSQTACEPSEGSVLETDRTMDGGISNLLYLHKLDDYLVNTESRHLKYSDLDGRINDFGSSPTHSNLTNPTRGDEPPTEGTEIYDGACAARERSTVTTILAPLEMPKFDLDYIP